jgi:hypothetical protein
MQSATAASSTTATNASISLITQSSFALTFAALRERLRAPLFSADFSERLRDVLAAFLAPLLFDFFAALFALGGLQNAHGASLSQSPSQRQPLSSTGILDRRGAASQNAAAAATTTSMINFFILVFPFVF